MVELYHSSARQLSVIEPREQELAGGTSRGAYVFAQTNIALAHAYCLMGENLIMAENDPDQKWCFAIVTAKSGRPFAAEITERFDLNSSKPHGYIHLLGHVGDEGWEKPQGNAGEHISKKSTCVIHAEGKTLAQIMDAGVQIYFLKDYENEKVGAFLERLTKHDEKDKGGNQRSKTLREIRAELESNCGDPSDVNWFEKALVILLNDYLRSEPHSPRALQQLAGRAPATDPS